MSVPGRSRVRSGVWRSGGIAAALVAVLASAACTPWGKPPANGPTTEVVGDFPTLFSENCSGCHGANGIKGPGRPLNNALYLALIPRDTLRGVIENGRPGTAMPPWGKAGGGPLTEKQIDVLVNGIETNWAKPVSTNAMPPYAADGENGDVAHGKKLFLKDCFLCHGKGAPVGMVTDASYLSLVTNQMLRTSIIVGRQDLGGLAMPDYRALNAGHALSGQDVSDLVTYLSSLRPALTVAEDAHTNDNETGHNGEMTKGNEGSGHGPGSPQQQKGEGNKSRASSQGGGVK